MGSKHQRQVKRLAEMLSGVGPEGAIPSDELTRLEEAIHNPARPRTLDEAMALGDDWGAIDISAIEEETFPLPIEVPDRHRWFLAPRRIRARKPEVAVHKVVADLSHRSAIRRRQAAGYLASWPSSADVERALLQAAKTDTDSWVVAFAAMSLAVHQYRGTAFLCGLVSAALVRDAEADIVGALLLAVAVSAAWDGSAGKLLTARECIEETGARPEYREVAEEILLALRGPLEGTR